MQSANLPTDKDGKELRTSSYLQSLAKDVTGESSILRLYLTSKCNMRCSFCSATASRQTKDKEKKEMSDNIKMALENVDPDSILWFGGEPLLKYPFMVDEVEKVKKRSPEKDHTVISNGHLLTPEMVPFLENEVEFIVSIDGYEKGERTLVDFVKKKRWPALTALAKFKKKPVCNVVITYEQLNDIGWYLDLKKLMLASSGNFFRQFRLIVDSNNSKELSTQQVMNLTFGYKTLKREMDDIGMFSFILTEFMIGDKCTKCTGHDELRSDGVVYSAVELRGDLEIVSLKHGCHKVARRFGEEQFKVLSSILHTK